MKTRTMSKLTSLLAVVIIALGSTFSSTSPALASEFDGLMFYYDFRDLSAQNSSLPRGTVFDDLSVNNRNGVVEGSGGGLSYDRSQRALVLPGGSNASAYVRLGGDFNDFRQGISVDFEANFGTLGLWERIFDFGNTQIQGEQTARNSFFIGQYSQTGELLVAVWNDNVWLGDCYTNTRAGGTTSPNDTGGTALVANEFAKWTITLDGSNCKIYKNGVALPTRVQGPGISGTPVTSAFSYLPPNSARVDNFIGRSNWRADNDFEGSLRYLRLYNRAISSQQVLSNNVTTYTISFDANGGQGSMAPQSGSSSATISPYSFTRNGYSFAGWNTSPTGSGTSYSNAAAYPFTASTTLYAQWTPDTNSQNAALAKTGSNQVQGITFALVLITLGFVSIFRRRRFR